MILFLSRISRMGLALATATILVYARVAPAAVEGGPADAGAVPAAPSDKEELQAKQLSNSEDDLALAKSGRLLRYGVTGGVAVTIQVPFVASHGARMETAAAGTAPYIGILPAFWSADEERAIYCSTTGLFQDGELALKAASAISRRVARIDLEVMTSWIKAVGLDKTLTGPPMGHVDARRDEIIKAIERFGATFPSDPEFSSSERVEFIIAIMEMIQVGDQAKQHLRREALADVIAAKRRTPDLAFPCGWYRVGFWAGRPLGYSAEVTINDRRGMTDLNPVVAFGLLYAPNSYVTVMGGFTYNTVSELSIDQTTVRHALWTATAGLGGTLDVSALVSSSR